MSESYCNKELELNLKAEQPEADWFKNKNKYHQDVVGRFCVGYNSSMHTTLSDYKIYLIDEGQMVQDASVVFNELPNNMRYRTRGTHERRVDFNRLIF